MSINALSARRSELLLLLVVSRGGDINVFGRLCRASLK